MKIEEWHQWGRSEERRIFLLSLPHSQRFAYEVISERCKSKYYTVLLENKFPASNFPQMDGVGKVSPLFSRLKTKSKLIKQM